MIDRLEYLIQLQEANLQISANNNVLLQRILAGMDEGNAFNAVLLRTSLLIMLFKQLRKRILQQNSYLCLA